MEWGDGTCSAASPAQIEFSSTSAGADQKIEPSRPSAELMTENSGGEVKAADEGESSAASAAQNEFSSSSAIAHQIQEQVEQGNPTSLLVENSVSCGEVKAFDKDETSAAPVPNAEKWSHEAIVARSNMRSERM